MSNNPQETSVDALVSEILGSIPEVERAEVRLPSLGRIYGLESDYIHLRAMTFDDEKALLSLKDKTQAVNLLISRCLEEDIDPRSLIQQDKIFSYFFSNLLRIFCNMSINLDIVKIYQLYQLKPPKTFKNIWIIKI